MYQKAKSKKRRKRVEGYPDHSHWLFDRARSDHRIIPLHQPTWQFWEFLKN